ncbi:hypothetical protein E2562_019804 [Oryza meyeriana var. granulata]|uniref:Leucine-rich repeat-containing N-terminal plant-type domain-containing protein n=1 Tax=Oryza meyeriana var. granulata TaxID=110450 RepID=A0A6G1DKN6_9ORYZ|nr:hypothetical protein E2562_019804 [Oryza meyeriana var. granulata]
MAGAQADSDHLALKAFKSRITSDPSSALASWAGNQSLHLCQWRGMTCGMQGRRHGRMVALDLSNLDLSGTIDPSIRNLTYLRKLDLPVNNLTGNIPSELGRLLDLRHVNLSYNSLEGGIPASLSLCKQLENISLAFNSLSGGIPPAMGDLPKLRIVQLQYNMLDGAMPRTIGSLGSLEVLNLYNNSLAGSIPSEIGNLTSLSTGWANEVSILGDVYSYGILLLEMFTGKRPTGSEFGEALSLHNYIKMALPDNVINIADQYLLSQDNDGEEINSNCERIRDKRMACITSILHIGISCSKESPAEHMQIGDALKELQRTKDNFSMSLR